MVYKFNYLFMKIIARSNDNLSFEKGGIKEVEVASDAYLSVTFYKKCSQEFVDAVDETYNNGIELIFRGSYDVTIQET